MTTRNTETEINLSGLMDYGIAICLCADFLNEHDDSGKCLICSCQQFRQDKESNERYLEKE